VFHFFTPTIKKAVYKLYYSKRHLLRHSYF
jgi:hypothetical protein